MIQNNSFAAAMASVKPQAVQGMLKRIDRALVEREAFERQKNPHKLHVELEAAKQQMTGNKTLARFYVVLSADPGLILNRVRQDGSRANLKTVRKVRILAEYMAGENGKINGVCKALFAATILAATLNRPWVSNNDAEKLLLALPVETMGQELRQAFDEMKGLNIRNAKESRNQACQFRTAFENLCCYFVTKDNPDALNDRGIYADLNNPLMSALRERWGL